MMGKRWTMDDDEFLVSFAGMGIEFIGQHDLFCQPGEATARVELLKKTGAWAALKSMRRAHRKYFDAVGYSGPPPEEQPHPEEGEAT